MCGASAYAIDWDNTDSRSMGLMRNISSNSSLANNTGSSNTTTVDDIAVQDDRLLCQAAACSDAWDNAVSLIDGMAYTGQCTSSTVSLRTSFDSASYDSIRPHLQRAHTPEAPTALQAGAHQLVLGTPAGIYQLDPTTGQSQLLGLSSVPVGHVVYNSCGLLLAACPVQEEALYGSVQSMAAAKEFAGLYCLNLKQPNSCGSSSGSCFEAPHSTTGVPAMKLWQGGATCCAFAPSGSSGQAVPRIYCGTQPADLIYSDDLGGTWSSCELSEAPQADSWFRRLPPYEPCVRAINIPSSSATAGVSAADAAGAQQQQQDVLVAVEVGGVLSSPAPGAEQDSSNWTDCSQALCRDVHALQADPFNPRCMYAVAGSGHLPGGVYRCKGKGQKWKRLFGYRYSVGMALSAHQKGRMLLVSAEKAPATGCILFESVDSGRTWLNISDDVADAVAALTEHSPEVLEQTPVTMFVPGGLILACASGHVFQGTARPLGGYSNWKLLTVLPAAVNCMCSTNPAVAPVAIQRV